MGGPGHRGGGPAPAAGLCCVPGLCAQALGLYAHGRDSLPPCCRSYGPSPRPQLHPLGAMPRHRPPSPRPMLPHTGGPAPGPVLLTCMRARAAALVPVPQEATHRAGGFYAPGLVSRRSKLYAPYNPPNTAFCTENHPRILSKKTSPRPPLQGDWGTVLALLTPRKCAAIIRAKRTPQRPAAPRPGSRRPPAGHQGRGKKLPLRGTAQPRKIFAKRA